MARKTVSLYLTEEQHAIVSDVAKNHGGISAYIKMLIDRDIEKFPTAPKWGDGLLGAKYSAWLSQQSNDYDPLSDQEGHYTYEWWLENVHGL